MHIVIGILGTIIIFGIIILVHEFGHFIVAKRSGMTVHEFSMGFGPALFSKEYGGTKYALRIVPLGGFVRIAGMEPGETDTPDGFDKKPFLARFGTILAGSVMNILLALVVLIILGIAIGIPGRRTQITMVQADSPAAAAQIQQGDIVLQVQDITEPDPNQLSQAIRDRNGKPVTLVLQREQQRVTVTVTPRKFPGEDAPRLGIGLGQEYERLSPAESVVKGSQMIYTMTYQIIATLGSIFTGHFSLNQVAGPIRILGMSNEVAQTATSSLQDFGQYLFFMALLSLNIGIFNLLPIPALDGSRLVILVLEGIRRKPFDKEKEALVHLVGFALLIALILLISVREVGMMIGR
ncbi:MAG: M50 family metallopeptidase [Armatimonadota bacterium]